MTETTNPLEEEATAAAAESDAADEVPPTEALQAEVEQVRAQYQRAVADYQNLERRSREERQELGRFVVTDVVRSFLPVLDDLDRAVEAASGEADEPAWLEGVRLVAQKFRGVLQHHGVEEIHALGEPFDPNQHEAVGAAAGPEGQVVHLLQRGYVLNERVIRPAMVMVGNGEDAASEAGN
jgi:molecular chaperone GrpE